MLYLSKEDSEVLDKVTLLLLQMIKEDNLNDVQKEVASNYFKLCLASKNYTEQTRKKAKAFVQEKRKADKTYAHTRKKKEK